jgi:hypothetical protein
MARTATRKKAAPKAKAKRKAATTRRPRREERPPESSIYARYRATMEGLWTTMGGGFTRQIREAVKTYDTVVVTGFWGYWVSRHPAVRPHVEAELKTAHYQTHDIKTYVAFIFDHTRGVEANFIKRFRDMLLSTFQRLLYLTEVRGERRWELPPFPTLQQIAAKLEELGGSDPETRIPNIHRAMVAQKTLTREQERERYAEEQARRVGISVEQWKDEQTKRQTSRQRDAEMQRIKRMTEDAIKGGQVVDPPCDPLPSDGYYVVRNGQMWKLSYDFVEPLSFYWWRHVETQKTPRAKGNGRGRR